MSRCRVHVRDAVNDLLAEVMTAGLHFRCVVCRDGALRPVSEGRDIGNGSWACNSHFGPSLFPAKCEGLAQPPSLVCPDCLTWIRGCAQAAELVRQFRDHAGPEPGDPFDADLWMAAAAELLNGGAM